MRKPFANTLLIVIVFATTIAYGWCQETREDESSTTADAGTTETDEQVNDSLAQSVPVDGTYESGFGLPYKKNLFNLGLNVSQGLQISSPYAVSPSYDTFSVSRLYGVIQLNRKNRRYQTNVDYKGGGIFSTNTESDRFKNSYIQQLTASEEISWHGTSLILEDAFNLFPGGNFGQQAFGGVSVVPGSGTLGSGGGSFYGFNYFGGLGQGVNINNATLAELTHELTPRSSFSISGGFALSNYIGNAAFIDYRQATASLGYYYKLSPNTDLSLILGYQYWYYPQLQYETGSSSSSTNTVQLGVQHQLSARLSFGLSGGAQFINSTSHSQTISSSALAEKTAGSRAIDATVYAYLSYGLKRSTLGLAYNHLMTSGSGYFAGSKSDIFQVTFSHPIGQHWTTTANAGFVRLTSAQSGTAGVFGSLYEYNFAGIAATRQIGRHYHFSAAYQFNDETFSNVCSTSKSCSNGQTHIALFEFAWRMSPARID